MTVPEPLPSRLIGALFVERGLISQTQLAVALQIQEETGKQLGQILVERFGVPRREVASVVAEQWARLGHIAEQEEGAARRRLGEIFLERGFVSETELELALQRQRETGERLGEALVAQGVISKFELAGALAEQASADDPASANGDSQGSVVELPTRAEPELVPVVDPDHVPAVEPEPPAVPMLVPVEVPAPPAAAASADIVAFAATPTGYRLVPLPRALSPGETVDLPDVGRLVALRIGRSPLPLDDRECVFLEPALG